MPQVTVYIRKEDLPMWESVVKKSEFMHNALQNHSTYDGAPIVLRETLPAAAEEPGADSLVCPECGLKLVDEQALTNHKRNKGHA